MSICLAITLSNLMITSITDTTISLSWTEPSVLNEEVAYYQVSLHGSYNEQLPTYVYIHESKL